MALSDLVRFVFSVGGAVVVLGGTALLAIRTARLAARRVFAGVFLFYLLASVHAVPEAIDRGLSAGFRPLTAAELPAPPLTLVVLGSGSVTVRDWDGNRYVTTDLYASTRVLEAVRIFRMAPGATVVSSGGLQRPDETGTPTGEAMAAALRSLGVPTSQLLVNTTARDTREEAVWVAGVLRSRPAGPVILVTTSTHMRRARGAFYAVGVSVIPAVARSPEADLRAQARWVPSDQGIWYSGLVAHELLGTTYYSLRGWLAFSPPIRAPR